MPSSFVLLHIAQTAVRVTTVDPAILTAACVAFAIAAIAIWLPRSPLSVYALRHRRGRRRLASSAVTVLVFVALLPSNVPYDHHITGDTHHDAGESEEVHASHCHISPGTCSDAPMSAGLGQLLMSEPLAATPALFAVLMLAAASLLVGISFRPEIRPPLTFA